LGETFIAESRWDWRIFETTRTEMSEAESELFDDQAPISVEDVLAFHRQLAAIEDSGVLAENLSADAEPSTPPEPKAAEPGSFKPRPEARRDFKGDAKGELKGESKNDPKARARDESAHHNHPPREG
jgi:hypothetical protein